jgi:hypothetical protein
MSHSEVVDENEVRTIHKHFIYPPLAQEAGIKI